MKRIVIMLAIAMLNWLHRGASGEQQEVVEPQIVETSVWLSVPQDVEKSEPTEGSWLSENGKIRWVPAGKLRYHKASGVLFAPAVNKPKPDEPEKR